MYLKTVFFVTALPCSTINTPISVNLPHVSTADIGKKKVPSCHIAVGTKVLTRQKSVFKGKK